MARIRAVVLVLLFAFGAQESSGSRTARRVDLGSEADVAPPHAPESLLSLSWLTGGSSANTALAQIGPPTIIPTWQACRSRISDWGSHIFAGLSIAAVVKVACMVGNLLVQVSPMPQVQDWEGKGSTGNAEAAPYVSMALGGWQWCTYGFAAWMISGKDGFLVLVYANCLGALLGCYYTFVFWRHCRDAGASTNLRQYLAAVACLATAQSCLWGLLPHANALLMHSCIAGGCSFVGAASLLTGLPIVFRTGDTSGLCGPLILAYFFGAFLWAYWGWLMNDPVIIASNLFAAFSSSICLYVKCLYEARLPIATETGKMGLMGQAWGKPAAASKGCAWPEEVPSSIPPSMRH